MWKLLRNILVALLVINFMASNVKSEENQDATMLELLLSGTPVQASQFSAGFLNAVPFEQINSILKNISGEIGAPIRIMPVGEDYEITTLTHVMRATIVLDDEGKIGGLFFRPPTPLDATLPDLLRPLEQVQGKTSYLILQGESILAQKDAEVALAIGSAFKLAILKALQNEISTGNRKWDDVVLLTANLRSLPSGILQDFPDGAPITLHTLAALMISKSDNTATDMLLALLGREKVALYLDNQFVLSTREFFQLKDDRELAEIFANANQATKLNISEQLKTRSLPSLDAGAVPYREGVEWYLSARALCELIKSVRNLDIFQINPGLALRDQWESLAFKGGSELGVFNLTTWMRAKNGREYCVVITINDNSKLPEAEIASAYSIVLGHLAGLND